MKRVGIVLMFAVLIMFASNISATIINVPVDQPNIQAGIGASSHGDTVRVESGTYVENINFNGKNIVVGSWFLDAGDPSFISSTIIDGNATNRVVKFQSGETNDAKIIGFTIQNGFNSDGGSGIFCINSSPTISNNTISGNSANGYGGGIACIYSDPEITNNTISGNTAGTYGGGGIFCEDSSPAISSNIISGNLANGSNGGGIALVGSSPTISNNTINGNTAGYDGGGILCYVSSPTISNNTISANSANDEGGGIACFTNSSPVITNTISWGDTAPNGPEIYLDGTSSPVITYCDIQGGWAGEGNIDCDPMFCDPDNGNFYLNAASCCVGAGEGGVDIGAFGVGCHFPYIINIPADYSTIQAGINASSNGDTVRVAPGTYVENINFYGKNIIVGSWFLDAGDTSYISSTIIDGNQSESVVSFFNGEDNTAVITGFTIQNGLASYGGGIYCVNSSPTISNNTISGNSVSWGGGIACYGSSSSPEITNNTISGNSAYWYGGGIYCYAYSSPAISNNTISGNSANDEGGGIYCFFYSSPLITNTILWDNTAPEIYLSGNSSPVITYCDVQGGWAGETNIDCDPMFCDPENGNYYLDAASCCVGAGEGGVDIGAFGVGCHLPSVINIPADYGTIQAGIDASSNGDTVRVASGTYIENINFSGKNIVVGSWFLDDGDPAYISSTIIDGNAANGVVRFESGETNDAKITGFTIQNGNRDYGGGIRCLNSSPAISSNTISGNSAISGGGIYLLNSNPTINYNTIIGNSASIRGGGIFCDYSSPTISNNTISGNSTDYDGGGIFCFFSNPTISNNTISGNSATQSGGGIDCHYSSPTISNNTISGNSATQNGGGIFCRDSNPVITNTIFWADNAPNGPEIFLIGTSSPVITYCDVQGGWAGETNINCDPMFCDPENGNFYLDAASCCVGAGEGGVDIGAFGVGCVSGSITGIVTDVFSRNPVGGATVNAWQEGSIVVTDVTETDGTYLLESLDVGLYDVEFIADGYFDDTETGVEVLAGQVTTVDMLLHKPSYYGGVVSDYHGAPLEGVSVDAVVQALMMSIDENKFVDDTPVILDVTPVLSDVTDALGQYTLILEPGTYDITYSMTDWDTQVVTDVVITLDDIFANQDVTLRRYGTLTGTVTELESSPVLPIENAHVTVDDDSRVVIGEDWTDVDGLYEIAGISDGDYTVTFTHDDYDTLVVAEHIYENPPNQNILDAELEKAGYQYLAGDVNMALGIWPPTVIGGDVTYLVGYFIGGGQVACMLDGFWCSADINGDCLIIGGDVTALVGYFVAGGALTYCPDYESAWLEGVPDEAPAGWPNCDAPVINSKVIPTGE